VVDEPRWPALDSIATPARMTFKMVWKSTGEPVKYEDTAKHFRFTGTRARCQMEAVVEVPSIGFSWKSDPLNTSKCDFASSVKKLTVVITTLERARGKAAAGTQHERPGCCSADELLRYTHLSASALAPWAPAAHKPVIETTSLTWPDNASHRKEIFPVRS
jgi:hypothetical protein